MIHFHRKAGHKDFHGHGVELVSQDPSFRKPIYLEI